MNFEIKKYLFSIVILLNSLLSCSKCNKGVIHSNNLPSPLKQNEKLALFQLKQIPFDATNNTIGYHLENQDNMQLHDIELRYTNCSEDEPGKKVTLNGATEGKVCLDACSPGVIANHDFSIDFHGAKSATFQVEVWHDGKCIKNTFRKDTFTSPEACLTLQEAQYTHPFNKCRYSIQNKGNLEVKDIELRYTNCSEDERGKKVTLNGATEGKVCLDACSPGVIANHDFSIDFHGAESATFQVEVWHDGKCIKRKDTFLNFSGFYQAIRDGNRDLAKVYLEKYKIDPNTEYIIYNLLIVAMICVEDSIKRIEMIELLLKYGAKKHPPNNRADSPLFRAIKTEDLNLIKVILPKEDIKNFSAKDESGNTPLHVSMRSTTTTKPFKYFLKNNAPINEKNNQGNTPLHIAVSRQNLYYIEMLLRHGAKTDIKNNDNFTPLELACHMNKTIDFREYYATSRSILAKNIIQKLTGTASIL